MTAQRYFDDPDEGLARATSHPAFVRACPEDLFYDCADDFGPFGNDCGSDALHSLQEWYRAGARGTARGFIDRTIRAWGITLPDLLATDRDTVIGWLDDPDLEMFAREVGNLVVAVAFGQLKITGAIDPDIVALAQAAMTREAHLNDDAKQRYPAWEYAENAREWLALKRAALERAGR